MFYTCKSFKITELVPPETLTKYGAAKCWLLFDDRLLRTLDCLRDQFGPIIINTWNTGGVFKYRGFRPAEYNLCAPTSQHYFGRAADMNFEEHTAEEARIWIKLNYKTVLVPKGCVIKRIENGTSWLHIDVGNTDSSDILYFNP